MLFRLVEQRESEADLIREGLDEALVKRVVQLLKQSEFKRKQGVIGPKVSRCAFGKDWRYPLMSGF
jgi:NAD+ synthase (glutamine-hydrolysing)